MNKRTKTLILILLIALSLAPGNPVIHKAKANDLIVTGTQVIENQVVHVNGSIIVKGGGTLILRNTTLVLDMASQCQSNITIAEGGTLRLEQGSNITTNSTLGYQILVNGTLNVTDSTLEYIGGCNPGIKADGPSPQLYFTNATIMYTGSYITVIRVEADQDSNPDTTGRLVVNGLYFKQATTQTVNYLISIDGDSVFNINRLNASDPSVRPTYVSDIAVTYYSTSLVTEPNYIENSVIRTLYLNSNPNNTEVSIINTIISQRTYLQITPSNTGYNALISKSKLNGTVTLGPLNARLEDTIIGSGTLRIQNSNILAENLTLLNPSTSYDALVIQLASYNKTVLLRDVKIRGLANAATVVRHGIRIDASYPSNNITIIGAIITPKPGEKPGGIYIFSNKGNPITIRDSVIPGITFNYINGGSYNAMNLYLSNVSTLDGKPIVIIRDSRWVNVSGKYGQVLVYNSSNINVRNIVFDSSVPGPIAVSHSANISLENITITRQPYIYGVKIMDSQNITLINININGSTTFPKLEGIREMNSTVTITESTLSGSMLINAPYKGIVVIKYSNINNTDPNRPAVNLLWHTKLVLDHSNITAKGGGIYSISGDINTPVCSNITITNSNIKTWTYAVKAHYTQGAIVRNTNITKVAGATDTQTLLDLGSDSAQSTIVQDSKIENNGAKQPILVQLLGNDNIYFSNNKILGSADVGLKIQSFTNESGYTSTVSSNEFEGQVISISLSSSTGVTVTGNTITSQPGYPGGIYIPYISFTTLKYARHDIQDNNIDGVPIVYVDSTTKTVTSVSQLIALNATVTIENLTLPSRPGLIQAYASKVTVKNAKIVVEDYGLNNPVIVDWLDSHVRLENTTIVANAPSTYLVSLAHDNYEHSQLVISGSRLRGTVYRIVDASNSAAEPALEIRDSVFSINGTIQRVISIAKASIVLVKNTVFNTSAPYVFFLGAGNTAYFSNVTFHSPETGSIITSYAMTISNFYSLTMESVDFRDMRGVYMSNIHVYYIADTRISTSDSYAGGPLFTIWGVDGVFYRPSITHTRDLAIEIRSGTGNVISPLLDNTTWTKTDPLSGWAVLQANGGNLRVAGLNATSIGGEPLRITGGTLIAHQALISGNPGYGLTVRGGTANVTDSYWGSPDGPNVTTMGADSADPEEIYYQNGTGTLYYSPYLEGAPSDNTPPEVNITAPGSGSDVNGLIDVNVTYSDNYGVMIVLVFLNNSIAGVIYPPSGTVQVDTSKFPDGHYTLRVVAYDWAGNSAEATVEINIKNYHPSARIIEPGDGDLVGGYVKVYVYIYDNNLDNWTLKADDTVVWTGYSTGYFTVSWDSSRFDDGSHTLKLEAWDEDGNYDSDSIVVTTDNTEPQITIENPGNNSVVGEIVPLRFTVTEDHPDTYKVLINGTLYIEGPASSGTTTVDIDTTGYQDGPYDIAVQVNDTVGNINTKTIRLVIDNTKPQVTITNPENWSVVSGVVDVNVTASDEYNVSWTAIYINGTLVYNETGPGPHTYEWNTSEYAPGLYNITAVAADKAGNTNKSTILVNVAATPVPEPIIVPLIIAILVIIILIKRNIKGKTAFFSQYTPAQ
ncbi:MAG: Ig-like domain-containing protein [Desulfurococcales archaeon]|nr:Ig-like domain-containing protein [Desulfurococcales archaeon]